MKKTINILVQGRCDLPVGTKLKQHNNGSVCNEEIVSGAKIKIVTMENIVNEVDFSEVPPLYPTPDMDIPKGGIRFNDGDGSLYLSGESGIAFRNRDGLPFLFIWSQVEADKTGEQCLQLKITLPETVTVCSGCFKETCECAHAEGWYRVYVKFHKQWIIRFWNGTNFMIDDGGPLISDWEKSYTEIDWENPINSTPIQTKGIK